MISRFNERITITLNKRLIEDLKKANKKPKQTLSVFIQEILIRGLEDYKIRHINRTPEEEQELQEIIRIAKTPWLYDDEGEDNE